MKDDDRSQAEVAIAARRYWMLQFIRLGGIFVTFLGAMMVVGRTGDDGWIGPVLFVAGPLLFFVVPIMLAKRWKSERR